MDQGNVGTTPARRPETPCLGLVGAPLEQEATSRGFSFWVQRDVLVEKTQLVVCASTIAGRTYTFYGMVTEVNRRSGEKTIDDEYDKSDGDPEYHPPFKSHGRTYAQVRILHVSPVARTPPYERSKVYLASEADVALVYGFDESADRLPVGLIENGGELFAGAGKIHLDSLLGVNGGHMNVNGLVGSGTKSTFLLHTNWMLLRYARSLAHTFPSRIDSWQIVPIILNVKGYDLFYLDCWNRHYQPDLHLENWRHLGVEKPHPFQNVCFFAPQQPGNALPIPIKRTRGVQAYSWSLKDIIEQGLFSYLFAEVDTTDANFGALALDIETFLTRQEKKSDGSIRCFFTRAAQITCFDELVAWVNRQSNVTENERVLHNHHTSTWKKFYRRLLLLVYQGTGVLRREEQEGSPLSVVRSQTSDPIVVDLFSMAKTPELQRFVVATIFRQLLEARTGVQAINRLVYVVTLDELNRFAPKGAHDSITRLIEMVVTEMRSQGVILLGSQQQASQVSEKVVENSTIRVLGRSGPLELTSPVWRVLSHDGRERAMNLRRDEKLVLQDWYLEPMLLRIPFPTWAMNSSEALFQREEQEGSVTDLIDE